MKCLTWNSRLVIACVAVAVACGGDDVTGPTAVVPATGTAVALKGTLASSSLSGDIDITIAAAATSGTAPITGCIYLKTATCVVTAGSYTVSTKGLTFTTTSPAISFSGTYVDGLVNGSFTHTGGAGIFTTRTGSVNVFCGTFAGASTGRWNFTISGSTLEGVY